MMSGGWFMMHVVVNLQFRSIQFVNKQPGRLRSVWVCRRVLVRNSRGAVLTESFVVWGENT